MHWAAAVRRPARYFVTVGLEVRHRREGERLLGRAPGEDVGEAVVDQGAEERLARQLRARRRGARDAAEEPSALPRLAERLWVLASECLERAAVDHRLRRRP